MKGVWVFISALAVTTSAVLTPEENLQLALSMPKCGFDCLQTTLLASPCNPLDSSCSCPNATITEQTAACVSKACTVKEQLSTKNITEVICERISTDGGDTPAGAIAVILLALVAQLLRLASRVTLPTNGAKFGLHFWWDDALITVSMIMLIIIAALSIILTNLGVGKDIWTLPFDNLTEILKTYYPDELLNLTALPLIKISLVLTIMRKFSGATFRKLAYLNIGLNVAFWIAFFFVTAFQCTPVSLAWNRWSETFPGTCRNINAQQWAAQAVDIFLYIVLAFLPMGEFWTFGLNGRQKMLLVLMYAVGLFTAGAAITRLILLISSASDVNLTKTQKASGYWAIIELGTGIICACLPGVRDLLKKRFPGIMGSSGLSYTTTSPRNGDDPTLMHTESGLEKSGTDVTVHGKVSYDRESIALQDYGQKKSLGESPGDLQSPLSQSFPHQRNFSHPYASPRSAWRADSTEDLSGPNRVVSPV